MPQHGAGHEFEDVQESRGSVQGRGEEEKMSAVVFGASNGGWLAEVLKEKGVNVSCAATPGWRLAGHRVKDMAEMASKMGKDEVLVLYGLDASVFLDVDDDMRSGPPRLGKDGRYHLRGKLTVVTGMQLEVLLENLSVVLVACGDRQVVIVTPSPRFWIQCCRRHAPKGDAAQVKEDKERLLRELGKFRRAQCCSNDRFDKKLTHAFLPASLLSLSCGSGIRNRFFPDPGSQTHMFES
jgi:hypothetical protein